MGDSNLETARRYLAALEQGVGFETMAGLFAPNVVQTEFPNRLTPNGATRDAAALQASHARGKQVIAEQRYEIQNAIVNGNWVALQVLWTGILAVPVASLPAGGRMQAHFAVFLEFHDGKIVSQYNYDCFDPW